MQFSGLRSWERVPAWIPFSNSLQWLFSASATLYISDYPFCCNWWNFILCNSWVIILLKIYKPAFLIIKYPCSTRDLRPSRHFFCLHSRRSVETYQAHFLSRAFKTSLRGCPVTLWAVQVLCMGFIGFQHNPRDTALSLLFPLSFHWLQSTRPRSVKKTTLCIVRLRRPFSLSLLFFGTLHSVECIFPFLLCLSLLFFFSVIYITLPETSFPRFFPNSFPLTSTLPLRFS